jgi:hypothetical protein
MHRASGAERATETHRACALDAELPQVMIAVLGGQHAII